MDNDFEMPQAVAAIYDFIRDVNKLEIGKKDGEKIIKFMRELDVVLGFMTFEEEIPDEILALAEQRVQARNEKDWVKSDKLRAKIKEKGFYVDDTTDGFIVKKL